MEVNICLRLSSSSGVNFGGIVLAWSKPFTFTIMGPRLPATVNIIWSNLILSISQTVNVLKESLRLSFEFASMISPFFSLPNYMWERRWLLSKVTSSSPWKKLIFKRGLAYTANPRFNAPVCFFKCLNFVWKNVSPFDIF